MAGGLGRPETTTATDVELLLERARAITGLDDYGDDRFVEPLGRYLESASTEGRLSPQGEIGLQALVERHLTSRLRYQDDLAKHPEILEEVIVDPIVIIGFPRTGTTKLQRMMSQDPHVQCLATWRSLYVAPPAAWKPGDPDSRPQLAAAELDLQARAAPDFMAAHPMLADEADEVTFLQGMTFESVGFAHNTYVPSYLSWLTDRPRRDSVEYLVGLLRYLQWQDGGGRGRPWILNANTDLGQLDLWLECFPNATLVTIHRDLWAALASLCRLVEVYTTLMSNSVDPQDIGRYLLAFWEPEMARNLTQRDRMPAGSGVVDICYDDMCTNTLGVIQEIYRQRALRSDKPPYVLSSGTEQRMLRWESENPPNRFGKHVYSLERFGLTAAIVESAFADYFGRFGPDWRQS